MATRNNEHSVTRTYRAAVRLGEDFITLEETITLPPDASDEDVQQAVDLGWRIYQAQRESVEHQVAGIRESQGPPAPITVRDPDAPASDKQRNYIAALQDDLAWTREQLVDYAAEHNVDFVNLNKGQASEFIDGLKKLAEARISYTPTETASAASAPAAPTDEPQLLSERQFQALLKLAQSQSVDLNGETQKRYGLPANEISDEQARTLLTEWQPRQQRNNRNAKVEAETAL